MSGCDCENYVGEGEGCEFYKITRHRARKIHDCVFCPFPIRPGSEYVYIRLKFDGDWIQEKYHAACDEMRETFNQAFGDPGWTCVHGELPQFLRCAEACVAAEPEDVEGDQLVAAKFVRQARAHMKQEQM